MDRKLYPYIRRLREAAPATIMSLDTQPDNSDHQSIIFYNGRKDEARYVAEAFKGLVDIMPDCKITNSFETQPAFFRDGEGAEIFVTDAQKRQTLVERNRPRVYFSLFSIPSEHIEALTKLLDEECYIPIRKKTQTLDDQRGVIISKFYHFRGESDPAFDTEFSPDPLKKGLLLSASRVHDIREKLSGALSSLVSPKYLTGLDLLADRLSDPDEGEGTKNKAKQKDKKQKAKDKDKNKDRVSKKAKKSETQDQSKKSKTRRPKLTQDEKQAAKLVEIQSPEIARKLRELCGLLEARLRLPKNEIAELEEMADLLEFEVPKTIRMRGLARKTDRVVTKGEIKLLKQGLSALYNGEKGENIKLGLDAFEELMSAKGIDPDAFDPQVIEALYNDLQDLIDSDPEADQDVRQGAGSDKDADQDIDIDIEQGTDQKTDRPSVEPEKTVQKKSGGLAGTFNAAVDPAVIRDTARYVQKTIEINRSGLPGFKT